MDDLLSPFATILNFRDVGAFVNGATGSACVAHTCLPLHRAADRPQHAADRPALPRRAARYDAAERARARAPAEDKPADGASPAEQRRLVRDFGVKTVLDLRSRSGSLAPLTRAHTRSDASTRTEHEQQAAHSAAGAGAVRIAGTDYVAVDVNGGGFARFLVGQLSWWDRGRLLYALAAGGRPEAVKVVTPSMDARGLTQLALDSLDVCGPELCAVFAVLADRARYPVMVHCLQGKDRTGLVVMLVLFLLGVPMDAVERDYLVSESELAPERDERAKDLASAGLSEHFLLCPPELVRTAHAHLLHKHGSVEAYLDSIGVTRAMQWNVKHILSTNSTEGAGQ